VRDQSGGVLTGATVELSSLDSAFVRSTATDLAGEYLFDDLPAGLYRVSAIGAGFERATRETIAVTAGEEARVDFVLALARQQATVLVTAPEVPEESLPTGNRTGDAATLLDGLPGVSLYRNGGVSSLPVIHGSPTIA